MSASQTSRRPAATGPAVSSAQQMPPQPAGERTAPADSGPPPPIEWTARVRPDREI